MLSTNVFFNIDKIAILQLFAYNFGKVHDLYDLHVQYIPARNGNSFHLHRNQHYKSYSSHNSFEWSAHEHGLVLSPKWKINGQGCKMKGKG